MECTSVKGTMMKIIFENQLSPFQKRMIFLFAFTLTLMLTYIAIQMPKKEPDCLRPLFEGSISQHSLKDACIQKLVDSVVVIEQLTFVIRTLLLAGLFYTVMISGISLYRWSLKP